MKIARLKWEVLECIGYILCEFTFQWFDRICDVPWDEEDWRWRDHVYYFIGTIPYKFGCYFYGLQDDEAAGVEIEVISESR
jgi:hypothetical protein